MTICLMGEVGLLSSFRQTGGRLDQLRSGASGWNLRQRLGLLVLG